MAYTSGTAANYKDLLAIMATFAAANGWSILAQTTDAIYMKGTGLAGLDEIYVGVETYEDAGNNRYNWNMTGSWGWRSGRAMSKQPMTSLKDGTAAYQVVGYFWNAAIPYWMVANGRRIIVCAKVGTTYQQIHLGLLDVPATDAQYPYPLFIGGSGNSLTQNYSATLYAFWDSSDTNTARLSFPGGAWGSRSTANNGDGNPSFTVQTFNEASRTRMWTALDGSYALEPLFVTTYASNIGILGAFDGLFRVTGYNNTAENIVTIDGVNHMVFPDGSRSGFGDYCAMRMS